MPISSLSAQKNVWCLYSVEGVGWRKKDSGEAQAHIVPTKVRLWVLLAEDSTPFTGVFPYSDGT